MRLMQCPGLALTALSAVLLYPATASAQVSGEILVGAGPADLATPLAAVAPGPSEPGPGEPGPGNLTEPQPVLLPSPAYPRAARAARQDGRVMVCFTVDERGRVQLPVVRSSTDPVFNEPVLEAISASRFTPARSGKQAVRSTACRTFRFELR